jgi:hypothetical protein
MREIKSKLGEHCDKKISNDQPFQKPLNELKVVKVARFHVNCRKHPSCPLQILRRRFQNFVFSNKVKKSSEKLFKSKTF